MPSSFAHKRLRVFLATAAAVIGLFCGIAFGQQPDPYAAAARQQALEQYKQAYDNAVSSFIYWGTAVGCKVMPQISAVYLMNGMGAIVERAFANAAIAGAFPNPRVAHERMTAGYMEAMREENRLANNPGNCDYWKNHLDEAARLRNWRPF